MYKEYYTKEEVEEIKSLTEIIYPNNDECYARVLKRGSGQTKAYNINALKDNIKLSAILNSIGKTDVLISLNPFRTMKSGTRENVFCINTIPIDIDYKKKKAFKDLQPFQVIQLIEEEYFDKRIPTPTLIEYGNQIRLIYCIETCYAPKNRNNLKVLCRRVSEVFANELKDYGAEKQNIESYMRVPNSINSKNRATVKLIKCDNAITYTLREIQELWLDELPKWYKKKKGRVKANNKIIKLHNVFTLNSNRLRDLEKIQEYINSTGEMDYRSRLCFLYRNFYLVKEKYQKGALTEEDYKQAEKEMLRFNNNFKEPYRNHVIEVSTRSVNHTQYLYKNETLLNYLELTWEKCEELGLESIYEPKSREERNKDYYKKNDKKLIENEKVKYKNKLKAKGKLTKKEELEILRQKIKSLLNKGFSQKEIAISLDIPLRTIQRRISEIKKQL